jgi:hypothetical protein
MTVRIWVMVSAISMTVAPVWCQSDRLGDVAGSIKLDRSAVTEGGGTVVDPDQVRKADRDLLLDVLDGARAEARRVAELVAEARTTFLYRAGDDLPVRLTAATRDLQAAGQVIWSLRLTPPFQSALDAARSAAEACDRASVSVRDELDHRGVVFAEATGAVATCRRQLEEAALLAAGDAPAGTGAGSRLDGEAGGAADDVAAQADARIAAFCEPERPVGPDAHQSCLDTQYQALAALEARTAASEMLDQDLFDGIRRSCGNRYPDDYVARDRCEQERMTSVRLEAQSP